MLFAVEPAEERRADQFYVAAARRYGTTRVSRDDEQRMRGAAVVTCQTPEEALEAWQNALRRSTHSCPM